MKSENKDVFSTRIFAALVLKTDISQFEAIKTVIFNDYPETRVIYQATTLPPQKLWIKKEIEAPEVNDQ